MVIRGMSLSLLSAQNGPCLILSSSRANNSPSPSLSLNFPVQKWNPGRNKGRNRRIRLHGTHVRDGGHTQSGKQSLMTSIFRTTVRGRKKSPPTLFFAAYFFSSITTHSFPQPSFVLLFHSLHLCIYLSYTPHPCKALHQ